MKTLSLFTSISIFILSLAFGGCGEKKTGDTQTKKEDKTTTQTEQQNTQTTIVAPKIGKIWESIQKKNDELNKTIESNKLKDVHEIAFAIRDLVKTLPDKSQDLGADKVEMLKNHVKDIEKTADLLDKYGDDNDMKNTKATYESFKNYIQAIKIMYPADSFK